MLKRRAMQTIELEVFLPADTAIVWDHILQPRLFCFVAKGVLTFKPVNPSAFPERWSAGQYRVRKYLWGLLPMGWQVIDIEFLPDQGRPHRLRDNGRGWMVPTWDHTMIVEPAQGGTRYTDYVKIEAGVLTPLVAVFARHFYKHRQRRWQKLIAADFDYTVS
ncbi:hypothetical protein MUY35_03090 [Aliiroseovarius sp. S1339]|uniref:hypothetical protein n=1 Tax=Aliiroseovarius sp. S1339 TaxID=2936990 RepID=UPI0020C04374|nr:hypothetical protein [Aliiroseovarius sp. S1339]MCK8462831.1 hypothetical protein [Aliiroseovarius sp. S1339]